MITALPHNYFTRADVQQDSSLGNVLFVIASVIGIAVKNNYRFGFAKWPNQNYFKNPLPPVDDTILSPFTVNRNYKGYDVGFQGFAIPDNSNIVGYLGSIEYWKHCEGLIKYYLEMKDIAVPYDDTITIHCRNYKEDAWNPLDKSYYQEALKHFPDRPKVVITDNIDKARKRVGIDCEYVSISPIVDFYLLSHSKYIIMANSTFSTMAAYLSKADIVVAPRNWYAGSFIDCPTEQNYLSDSWIRI